MLLDAGQNIEEQLQLLERAHCLSARGLADRPTVVALLERAAREYGDEGVGGPSIEPDGRWLCDAVRDALRGSGYLDELGWATLESGATPENPRVQWLVSQVRGVQTASVPGPAAAGEPVRRGKGSESGANSLAEALAEARELGQAVAEPACSACGRQLPRDAAFCGYCGQKLNAAKA